MKRHKDYHAFFKAIDVDFDRTDHIIFLCPYCKKVLRTASVKTQKHYNGRTDGDSVTRIWLVCDNCKLQGQRKFYWNNEIHPCQARGMLKLKNGN